MTPADALLVLASPAVGSFLGLLIRRLPVGGPIVAGRSRCESCATALAARDLVPVLSWLLHRARCRHCGATLPSFYPAIELAALGVAVWAATQSTGEALLFSCTLGWALLVLGWLDRNHLWLPDAVTLPLLALGLIAAWRLDPAAIGVHAAGAALGWAGFAAIAWVYRRWRGRDGLGGGDAKLLGVAGAWLGAGALPWVVLAAALGGLLEAAVARRDAAAPIAFGVWLAVTIWLAWLYGVPRLAG